MSKDRGRHDFVGLGQVVPGAEEADVFGNNAAGDGINRQFIATDLLRSRNGTLNSEFKQLPLLLPEQLTGTSKN